MMGISRVELWHTRSYSSLNSNMKFSRRIIGVHLLPPTHTSYLAANYLPLRVVLFVSTGSLKKIPTITLLLLTLP